MEGFKKESLKNLFKYYRLTYPQMAIWQTEKFFPGTSFGNIVGIAYIKDIIDFELLEKAVNLVIMKNDGLRFRIIEDEEQVKQYIADFKYMNLDFFDFSKNVSSKDYEDWCESKTREPFKLLDSDLFYYALLKISKNEYGLYIKNHHLISDAWTGVTQASNIIEIYYKLKKGINIDKELEPSYIDFISIEDEYLKSEKYLNHRNFWCEKFNTIPEFISFKPVGTTYRNIKATRKELILSKETTSNIYNYCEKFRVSPFTVFLAAGYIYINRVTSKQDIVIGTPILNRSNVREKNTAGMFISVLPVRFQVNENLDLISFINSISKEISTLLRHHKYPYDLIQTEFREKYKVNEPLFDVMISYQNAKIEKTELTGDYELVWQFNGYQTDSLQIHVSDRGNSGEYTVNFDYLIDTFKGNEIENMCEQYVKILEDLLRNPYKKVCELDIISDSERKRLLKEFNNTDQHYPANRTINQLFEEQVRETPENIAVVFQDAKITYSELNNRANQLACILRNKGVKPDDIVSIMVERSIELVICVLGVLKAGGAFLTLDNNYPEDRLKYMVQDSKCKFMLVKQGINKINFNGEFIVIDGILPGVKQYPDIENVCTSANLAYLIYTSGSTGEPKGVMLEHRGIASLKEYFEKGLKVTSQDRIIQFASSSFDASVWEFFMALLTGASLYIVAKDIIENYIKFEQFLNKNNISIATLPPSYLANLDPEKVVTLKKLISAGSSITHSLIKKWCNKLLYINAYGPTETTICATVWECNNPDAKIDFVPIGKPIYNTKIFIVNKHGQLQPIGIPGELCISGDSLARGYINKPELTAEKFVPCSFYEGKALYKTGDLARWMPDGNIEFLGRLDNQVKIRGFRVELGEIENLLLNRQGVKDAYVMDRRDKNGDSYLCAYVVIEDETLDTAELKEYLSKKLPGFMVPSQIIELRAFPIGPNGKIDKKKLPSPVIKSTSKDIDIPKNEIEKLLVEVWKESLNIQSISLNDNIFELGADSLAIMRVLTQIFKYGWDISMQDFYEFQTIRQLSEKILGMNIENNRMQIAAGISLLDYKTKMDMNLISRKLEPECIFLTGATGFLGNHILSNIIENSKAIVYCLIREKDEVEALKRLKEKLEFYSEKKFINFINKRIFVTVGDINLDNFGLSEREYELLAKKTDTVIHTAAIVKHFGNYSEFENTNVLGTQRVINFCMNSGAKLNHISTISISGDFFEQSLNATKFSENDFYIGQNLGENVYLRSKFEGERLVLESATNGLDVSIYRVGNLTGRNSDGLFQPNITENRFYNLLRFFINLRIISTDVYGAEVELTPVDVCARAIFELSKLHSNEPKVYHLYNPNKLLMKDLVKVFNLLGGKITTVSTNTYKSEIENIANDINKKETLIGVVNEFTRDIMHNLSPTVEVSCEITEAILSQLEIKWPKADLEYLTKLYQYMQKIGFIS